MKILLGWCGAIVLAAGASVAGAACDVSSGVVVQVLGAGGPEMSDGRASSAYLVWQAGRARLLVDAGSGAALNFERSGASMADLDAVLFTHFHVDHSAAFPFLVKASYFEGRDRDLPVFGPDGNDLVASASEFIDRTLAANGAYPYLADYTQPAAASGSYQILPTDVPLNPPVIHGYPLADDLSVAAIQVTHGPIAALAWRVDIDGVRITFSGDTSNAEQTLEVLASNSDLLIAHNAVPEGTTGIAQRLHMPPSEIGRVASESAVADLVLSHRMERTWQDTDATVDAIRRHYEGPVRFAEDMQCFPVSAQ